MGLTKERSLGIILIVCAGVAFAAFYYSGMIANLLSTIDDVLVAIVAVMITGGAALIYRGKEAPSAATNPTPAGTNSEVAEQLRLQNERESAKQRKQRYAKLNENVLVRLREYTGSPIPQVFNHDPWNQLRLVYDLSGIRANPFFEECKKHLGKDSPGVIPSATDIESKSRLLNNQVTDYKNNTAATKVKDAMEIIIEDRHDMRISDAYTNRPNEIYLQGLMNFLSASWVNPVSYYQSADRPLDDTLVNQIVAVQQELPFQIGGDKVTIEGTHMATLPTQSLQKDLVASVKQLQKDVIILKGIVDLARNKQDLQRRIDEEVRKPVGIVSNQIASETYDNPCDDCPR